MNFEKELSHHLFLQQQDQSSHVPFEEEFGVYKAIATGNMEEVLARQKECLKNPDQVNGKNKNNILSADPLQNQKYHFVIFAALVSRFCAQYGLPREISYSMNDIFVRRMDVCTNIEDVKKLRQEMIISYTKSMQANRNKGVYSKQIVKCMDYIHANLQQDLKIEIIADALDMNPNYLSRLFKKETKVTLSSYIKTERLKSAAYLLQYTNYSIAEISEYLQFSSQSHFTSSFQKMYGLTPKHYRDFYTTYEAMESESPK